MKEFDNNILVDVAEEKCHVVDYIMATWGVDDQPIDRQIVADAVDYYFDIGYENAKGWFSTSLVMTLFSDLDARKKRIEVELAPRVSYFDDAVYGVMDAIYEMVRDSDTESKKNANYDKETKKARNNGAKFPKGFSPNRWNELYPQYEDYAWMRDDEWNHNDLFKGYDSSDAGSGGLHHRIVLPYAMYDEINQDRNRFHTITGAIYAHGLFCKEHNNGVKVRTILDKFISEHGDKPFTAGELEYNKDSELMQFIKPRFSDAAEVAERAKLPPLTPEEKKKQDEWMLDFTNELLTKMKNKDS